MFGRMSRGWRSAAATVRPRPTRSQLLLGAAIGLATALAPLPAVPLSAGDNAASAKIDEDAGAAEALAVRTVLRLADAPYHRSSRITTS